jgi:guanylate kinase
MLTFQPASKPYSTQPIVISGPSGTGKSTLLKKLFAAHPSTFAFSISHTTRAPRAGEQNGREYHFVTKEDFTALKGANGFIETAQFSGNFYGTSVSAIKEVRDTGRVCILDIEMEGVRQVEKHPDLDVRVCFIAPPSIDALKERLTGRGTENEESLKGRLDKAVHEMEFGLSGEVEGVRIINDDLDTAYGELESWIMTGKKPTGS